MTATAAGPAQSSLLARLSWVGLAVLSALCYLALAFSGPLRGPGVAQYLVLFSVAFVLYLAALALLGRRLPGLWLIWGAAVIFRAALWLSPPTLSDDVYRYIWDGHVAINGVNPYAHTVNAPALDPLATPLRPLVNNDWMASPYLPAAQLVFSAVAALAPQSPAAFQVVMSGFDLLAGGLLMLLLRRAGRPPALAVVYLWNPLVVTEFAHGAHLDALMIALILGALAALASDRRGLSAGLLGLATLTKGIPALLLAALWPRWRRRDWLIYLGVVIGLSLPYAWGAGLHLFGPRDGVGLFGAIRLYAYQWNFNGGLYHWLEGLTTGLHSPGAIPPDTPGAQAARWIAAGTLCLVLTWTAWRARTIRDDWGLLRLCLIPFAAYLLLTTTVHPWYVTLLVPFAAIEAADRWSIRHMMGGAASAIRYLPSAIRHRLSAISHLPIVYWSWSVGLSYLTYLNLGGLRESEAARRWGYWPLFLLVALVFLIQRRSSIAQSASSSVV